MSGAQVRLRTLREFPGGSGVSIHFRPVRNDLLFESAKVGGALAYRILSGEGIVRGQLWAEFEVLGEHLNVIGRSSDLLFALALITATWKQPAEGRSIAATGVLNDEGAVQAVERTVEKVAAAVRDLQSSSSAVIFYPAADAATVESWRVATEIPAHVELRAVAHVEDALAHLGYSLEKVYLRSPFRGLEHFDYEHHSIFFGREREVRDVLQQLLRREEAGAPGLLVEGPSGSGKSSFLRAGVLPALVHLRYQSDATREQIGRRPVSRGSSRAIWRPGLMPSGVDEHGVVLSIRDCWRSFPELQMGWDDDVRTLEQLARQRREHWPAALRFVWMIDQFEEIFAIGMDAGLIEALGSFLGELQSDAVWTLAAVRADAMAQLKGCDSLRHVFGSNEGQYYLTALRGAALDDVIAMPARAGDLKFETSADGKSLDQVLREEAYLEPNSLPLLQFTLNELYLRRSGNELTYAAYRQLGGLAGSVATAAEAVLKTEDSESQRVVPRVFRSLVSVDEAGRATRRYASLAEIAQDPTQKRLTLRLVEARLCVTDRRDGEAVVAFAHDSLLRSLPALTEWLKQEAGLLQARELAQREARLWQQHGEADSWLATSDKLVAFGALDAAQIALPDAVRDFIRRSQRRVRRTTLVKRTAIGVIAFLAITASAGAWIAVQKEEEAEYQTAQAIAAQSRLLTETASARLNEGDVDAAQKIVIEVLRKRAGTEADTAAALNVFQQARTVDAQVLALTGHTGRVRTAAFSPDGKQIVTASLDGSARIWDVPTGRQVLLVDGHASPVYSAAFSPDGKQIVTASTDKTARIWDVATARQLLLLSGHTDRLTCAAYSPDGKRIVTASWDGTARVWDTASAQQLLQLSGHTDWVACAAFSPDGRQIVTASADMSARIWNATTGSQVRLLNGHTGLIYSAAFSPDGKQILTASADKTARTWDVATGRQVLVLNGHADKVSDARFSPDGKQIVTASWDNSASVWDAATGRQLRQMRGHSDWVNSAGFSPDGRLIVTASYDKTARMWDADVASARQVMPLIGHTGFVSTAVFSADGKRILTSSFDGSARMWDVATGRQLLQVTGHAGALNAAVFLPDNERIVTASDDRTARVWDAKTGRQLLLLGGHTDRVISVAVSPDGKRIVTSSEDKTARTWDSASGKQMLVLSGHTEPVYSATFSPDGKQIVTASDDKSARIWDSTTGRQVLVLNGHSDSVAFAAFSPDGRRIVTVSVDQTARVWDAATGRQVLQLSGQKGFLQSTAFSPDGKRIVTAASDGTARIWDAMTGRQLLALAHADAVESASFSPDGNQLVTASDDKIARIWDARVLPIDVQIEYAEATQFEPLSKAEGFRLGLEESRDVRRWRGDASDCDVSAAAPYDPRRQAPGVMLDQIVPDIAAAACAQAKNNGAIYQHGRAMMTGGNFSEAKRDFEGALAGGYPSAQIELAMLLSRPTAGLLDIPRAISLYEQAWKDGIPFAGFALGNLYEHGVRSDGNDREYSLRPNQDEAWVWYRRAADAREPYALARFAERAADAAFAEADASKRNGLMLESFGYYAAAVERARVEDWPDDAWRNWRYRRASLARLLGREGMRREIAVAFDRARTSAVE